MLGICAIVLFAGAMGTARAASPYEINVVLSLTGAGAFLGVSESKTVQAIETLVNKTGGINGQSVHFVFADDQSSPQVAVQLTNGLVAQHVPVMLGPSYTSTCYAVLPIVKNGPVQYCYAPTVHTTAPSFTFSGSASSKDLALAGIRYFREHRITKIALLVTTDSTGQDGESVVREDLGLRENASMSLVAIEHFNPADISIAAQITRLKASGAQAVIAWVAGTPFGTVLKGAVDGDLGLPILTNSGNLNNAQMAQYAAFLPKELYFTGYRFQAYRTAGPGPVRDADMQFIKAMRSIGVAEPDAGYEQAWDATMIVVDALRHLGTNASAEQLRSYIAAMHGYAGINGIMDFRDGLQRGLKDNAAVIVRWDAGGKTWVPVSKPGGFLK